MRKKNTILIFLFFLFSIMILMSCLSQRTEKKLSPEEQEFLSKVRFIITREERKIFLRLPPTERGSFVEEFWTRRDLSPETEENEYKDEYFSRIEEANRLFRGEGTPGWLTDRGRIYILFGPPFSRKTYSPEYLGGGLSAQEIWYYGNFPVVFIDKYNSGVYRLMTTNLAVLNELNFALRKIRKEEKKRIKEGLESLFDFSFKLTESANLPVLLIEVPYKNIWFSQRENALETTINLAMKIFDANKNVVFQYDEDHPLSLTEEYLKIKMDKFFTIEIPVLLTEGEYSIQATLINKTDEKKAYKEFKIKI